MKWEEFFKITKKKLIIIGIVLFFMFIFSILPRFFYDVNNELDCTIRMLPPGEDVSSFHKSYCSVIILSSLISMPIFVLILIYIVSCSIYWIILRNEK